MSFGQPTGLRSAVTGEPRETEWIALLLEITVQKITVLHCLNVYICAGYAFLFVGVSVCTCDYGTYLLA
jgi:hypothetical protein